MDYSKEFPLAPDLIYLNHAAVGPWPARTAAAVRAFADENMTRGAQRYPAWMAVEQQLRDMLAQFIGARSSDEIALLKSTSEGLSVIAYGLDWKEGDNVIFPASEFPSNRIVWESLIRFGVEARAVDIYTAEDPEAALLECVDSRTRLLSVSSVQFDTGLRLDLTRLGRACESAQVLFCVDAIQSLGALPLNVREIRADFVVADGHKWLLGPEGLALFYCRREILESLQLCQFGWHMTEQVGNFDQRDWAPAKTARRFECGSPNMLGIHALNASLSLLQQIGMQTINDNIFKNTSLLIDIIDYYSSKFSLVTPRSADRHAGIVSFRPSQGTVDALFQHLTAAGVVCAVRGGAIRFSPHFYTPTEQLGRAMALLG